MKSLEHRKPNESSTNKNGYLKNTFSFILFNLVAEICVINQTRLFTITLFFVAQLNLFITHSEQKWLEFVYTYYYIKHSFWAKGINNQMSRLGTNDNYALCLLIRLLGNSKKLSWYIIHENTKMNDAMIFYICCVIK